MKTCKLLALGLMAALFQTKFASAQSTFVATCIGGQGPTTSTNFTIRNLPIVSAVINITNVRIYNSTGTIIFNSIPPGMATTVNSGATTGFLTKNFLPANAGIITALISFTTNTPQVFYATAAILEADSAGTLISRDTTPCNR